MAETTKAKQAGSLAWALGIAAMAILFLGAIAGPKMIKFQGRSKQSEAKANLKSLYVAEQGMLQERGAYVADLAETGFFPERGNRYTYFLAESGPAQRRNQATLESAKGLSIIGNDTYRHSKDSEEEVLSFAQTGCPVTAGKDKAGHELRLGITATGFIAVAAHRTQDTKFDCWSIASMDRSSADGQPIPAGQPYAEADRP